MNPDDIVDEIERARARNNIRWVDLLRVAMEAAPQATRLILEQINHEDDNISDLTKQLTEKLPR